MQKIRCKAVGLDALRNFIKEHPSLEREQEIQWIEEGEKESLYHHNLIYPYGVARRYALAWIPLEDMIDISLEAYENGLEKYLEEDRDFPIGEYVVWWSKKACMEHIIQRIIGWRNALGFQPESPEKIQQMAHEAQKGSQGAFDSLMNILSPFCDRIEDIYKNALTVPLSDEERRNILQNVMQLTFSNEEYTPFHKVLSFLDAYTLEHFLYLDKKI